VGLERGSLSLVSTTEKVLEINSSGSGLETREYGRGDPLRWPRDTLNPQKLALTSPTCGGRSELEETEVIGKNMYQCTLSTTNPTWTYLGSDQKLQGGRRRRLTAWSMSRPKCSIYEYICIYINVTFSLYRPWRPLGLWDVEAHTFSGIRLTDGGKAVSPTRRPLFAPRKIPGTHLC
jgi:hypothetical protein